MYCISGNNIKQFKLTALFILSPLFFFAQSLTGLWTGTLSNDSTTVRKDQLFEIALTEYRGKVYGYSRSEFIVNDTLFYIVKRVKGTIEDDVCEVTDDEILSYNFRGKLDKGVKVTSTFRRNQSDSTWYLDGTWKTNATKKYYAVTGKVDLQNEKDLNASKLFPHLEELNIAKDVAFYKEFLEKEDAPVIVRVAHPEKIKTEYNDRPQPIVTNNDIAIVPAKPALPKIVAGPATISFTETNAVNDESEKEIVIHTDKTPVADLPKNETKKIPASSVDVTPSQVTKTIAAVKKTEVIKTPETSTSTSVEEKTESKPNAIVKAEVKNEQPVVKTQPQPEKQPDVAEMKKEIQSVAVNNRVPEKKETKPMPIVKAEVKKEEPVVKTQPQPEKQSDVAEKKKEIQTAAKNNPVPDKKESKPVSIAKAEVKKEEPVVKTQPPPTKQPDVPVKKTEIQTVAINNPVPEKKEVAIVVISQALEEKKSTEALIAQAAVIEGRKSEFSQVVNFKTDSLVLSLYDNGEIDGDTVSVYMNGEVLMAKQGLKLKAIKKTIYISKENEEFTLVMFADNLGKYPPNTGLLVVHDGDDVYNLRFSSDLKKSAGIVFRRKK